ncbi:MAG: lamin tail domain-containing protein, partial [Candidatus Portnoybacteria bacterium]|nr:lamin tail domain-containing protein [Candidatus Portnoybacteria bacterium]
STEIEISPPESSPTSTEATTTTVQIVETATTTQIESPVDFVPSSNTQYLRLNEVMPDPVEGPEWVEITNAMPDRSISLDGLELHDAVGKFMTLKGSVTSGHLYVVFNLSSARLNNSGDSLYLKTPDGQVIDSLTYAYSNEDVAWARDAQGAWRETVTLTPGTENFIEEKPAQNPQTSNYEPVTIKKPKKATTKVVTVKPKEVEKVTTTTTKPVAQKSITQAKAKVQTAAEKKTVAATKTATKKATTSKSTSTVKAPLSIDFDMLNDDSYGGIRVKLAGLVGSPSRLLTGRSFVLLNTEGRGLLVKVPAGMKMPTLNTPLEVTGTLKFDTRDFPYLSLTKNDRLTLLKSSTTSTLREVTWWAPATEDAWSLVSATGTVQAISGSTVNLLVDDSEVDLKIKSGVNYRAARLKKGDVINVTGLLDLTSQRPAILPRTADDITLISYATNSIQQASEPQKPSGLPSWTPFGAALGAIGAVEGVKKLRGRKKVTAKTT